jgi:hypothetical protein
MLPYLNVCEEIPGEGEYFSDALKIDTARACRECDHFKIKVNVDTELPLTESQWVALKALPQLKY